MGRAEGESVSFAKLIYPPMQVADIFMLQAHFAHGGMDQRKAHVIARDVAEHITIRPLRDGDGVNVKPVILHHHLLLGLDKPPVFPLPSDPAELRRIKTEMKMSKSRPNSAVFVHDSPDEIREKIRKAFCPPDTTFNPVLDWIENLIFNNGRSLHVPRDAANGGPINFATFESLKTEYAAGALHAADLKNAAVEALIDLLAPVRAEYASNVNVQQLADRL
jgi:tyrosyl-tRNA synthetase